MCQKMHAVQIDHMICIAASLALNMRSKCSCDSRLFLQVNVAEDFKQSLVRDNATHII